MDWAGWAVLGLVATTGLTAVMIAAQLAGRTRLDLPLMLGTITTEDPDRARVAGFASHLAIGQVFTTATTQVLTNVGTSWLSLSTTRLAVRHSRRVRCGAGRRSHSPADRQATPSPTIQSRLGDTAQHRPGRRSRRVRASRRGK